MKENQINQSERAIEALLRRLWKSEDFEMIGEYRHSSSPAEPEYGYIWNPLINDRNIYYPENNHKRVVAIRVPKSDTLIEGKYYRIKAKLAPAALRQKINNPYLLVWDDKTSIRPAGDFLYPREFIEAWFHQTGSTPKDAATIASQLKLNSLELYTQTERFIFELIQNADDMPSSEKGVRVQLQLLNNFLLFRHNGKFFDRDDVRAIADAAQSNKSENVRQTGYKGIGFKSVFTDSNCVYIRSGSYSFKFDKNDPIYTDFWKLYSRHVKLLENSPRDFELFKTEYEKNKDKWDRIDNIPWQIKPIWVDKEMYPEELVHSEFVKHAEVNIALEIGENTIKAKNYAAMIGNILSKPKFILFLRNTVNFDYYKLGEDGLMPQQTIALREKGHLIEIVHNDQAVETFSKIHFDVEISNDEFKDAGFDIEKYEEKPGLFKFKDAYGEIKSIPEKLSMLSSTRITFASQIKEGKIIRLDKNNSILYNYLPTSDQRFGFPFLINADFITNTSREFILKENKWNHYLMYHIGIKCVECITQLSKIGEQAGVLNSRKYTETYLNLLPESLLQEEDEELSEINKSFNRGFLKSLNEKAFVVNSWDMVVPLTEIILDDTGISDVLGRGFFKTITASKKELPSSLIDTQQLRKPYLTLEKYQAKTLIADLQNELKHSAFRRALLRLDSKGYEVFLDWLDQFAKTNHVESDWLLDLPIVCQEKENISLRKSLKQKDFLIRNEKTKHVEKILKKIGLTLSEFSIDEPFLQYTKQVILAEESYLQSDLKLYKFISTERDFSKLKPGEKNSLLQFFKELKQVGPAEYSAELKILRSESGKLRSLHQLINVKELDKLPKWLHGFVVEREDQQALSTELQRELLQENDLIEKLYCESNSYSEIIKGVEEKDLKEFYTHILNLQKGMPEQTKISFSGIPWVYIEASNKFVMPNDVYWPDSLMKLSEDAYGNVKTVIESLTTEQLAHYEALPLKKALSLGSKPIEQLRFVVEAKTFDLKVMKDFLDWIDLEGNKKFLSEYTISEKEGKYVLTAQESVVTYFTEEDTLITFIKESGLKGSMHLLPKELYTEQRNKIGLIEGEALLKYLIVKGIAEVSFAGIVYKANLDGVSLLYLERLTSLPILSSKDYTSEHPEHKILKLALRLYENEESKLNLLKGKITIDGYAFEERAISDDVRMFPKDKGVIELKTKLKEILPAYAQLTYSVKDIIRRFKDFRDDAGLSKVFKSESKSASRIVKELSESKLPYYSPAQTFFLSFYAQQNAESKVLEHKVFFPTYHAKDPENYSKDMHQFFDICMKENNYTGFVAQGIVPGFLPTKMVNIPSFAIEKEKLPVWLESWIDKTELEDKRSYMKYLGINDEASAVVLYRKAIREVEEDAMNSNLENVKDMQMLIQTLEWMANERKAGRITVTGVAILKPLYQKLSNNKVSVEKLLFPSLIAYGKDDYLLVALAAGEEVHYQHEGWGKYKQKIFETVVSSKKITDDVLPKVYRVAWKLIEESTSKDPDYERLKTNSYPFDADYYANWIGKNRNEIRVYKGTKLPFVVVYQGLVIEYLDEKEAAYLHPIHYVVENKKEFALSYLDGVMSQSALDSLKLHHKNIEEERKKESRKRNQVFTRRGRDMEKTFW